MKQRFLSTLLALCMALSLLPGTAWAEDSVSGSCGDNLTWTLTESGTLTISGTGNMSTHYYWRGWVDNYVPRVKKVVINRGVNSIADSAFENFDNLTSVSIPSGVTSIGKEAFYDCDNLSSISVPSTVETIGSTAFCGCDKLSKVTIANGVTTIGKSVFASCTSLKSISLPSSVKSLGQDIFYNCKNLTNVTLPSGMKSIPAEMFADCTSLFTLEIPDGVISIGESAFDGCTNLSGLTLPNGVATLGSYAFADCTNLSALTLPSSVTTLGIRVFKGCVNLKSIEILNGVQFLSSEMFQDCGNLKCITIPASVTRFGYDIYFYQYNNPFSGCTSLTDIYYAKGELGWMAINHVDYVPKSVKLHYNSTGPTPAKQQYTVFFDTNGGTMTANDSKTVTKGGTYGTLPTPKRTGYTFKGWYTKSSGGSRVSSGTKVNLTGDQTLYAQWTKSSTSTTKYTIKFNANGGTVSKTSITVAKNAAYGTLPTPTRSGYSFKGWYTAKTGGTKVSSTTKATASCTMYAQWTKSTGKTYTITLNANGGRVSPSTKKVAQNENYGELPVPTRDGYLFDGWYTSRTGGTEVTEDTRATADRTVYAHWTEEEPDVPDVPDIPEESPEVYTVTFNPNGGRVHQRAKMVVSGGTYQALPIPYQNNYHFAGWYTAKSGGVRITDKTDVNLTGNQTLYAHWTKSAVYVESMESGNWQIRFPSNFHFPVYNSETAAEMYSNVYHGIYATFNCSRRAKLSNGTVRYYAPFGDTERWFTYTCEMDMD